jgi:hypothetical protein
MSIAQQQFEKLRSVHADAGLTNLSDGSGWVVVPNFPLPLGWSQPTTTVRFHLLPAYPNAKPDCFWTDAGLKLSTGSEPQATRIQPGPSNSGELLRWFSWHLSIWSPNRDSLLTYLAAIKRRLSEIK